MIRLVDNASVQLTRGAALGTLLGSIRPVHALEFRNERGDLQIRTVDPDAARDLVEHATSRWVAAENWRLGGHGLALLTDDPHSSYLLAARDDVLTAYAERAHSAVPDDHYWTDYPWAHLGDLEQHPAPVRTCRLLGYDGDKYAQLEVAGEYCSAKLGYVYLLEGRCGAVPQLGHARACEILGLED